MAEPLGVTPVSTVQRLSVYLRTLREAKAEGKEFISSNELAERNGYTSAQVRKDFSCFGSFGKKGKGYKIASLVRTLEKILGLSSRWRVALIGLGHLGETLIRHKGFQMSGFDIVAIFDIDEKKINTKYEDIPVFHMNQLSRIAKEKRIGIAIIAIPKETARQAIKDVVDAGIKGILNFSEVRIPMPPGFVLKNFNLTAELETIAYYLTHPDWLCRGWF